jgi:hypothetical protein
MRQNRNQRRLCSADRDPSLRFFDPQRQENRSRTKFFSSLLERDDFLRIVIPLYPFF